MIIDNPRPEHIPALQTLWRQAFADPEDFIDAFFSTAFSCERCRCVFLEGQPVAALYLFDCFWGEKKLAYLYGLAVDAAHRRKGLSRLLLTDTHAALQIAGCSGIVLEPAEPCLKQYYQTLGYKSCGGREEKTVCAGQEGLPAQKLGLLGYQRARKAQLPENGILQEDAFAAFIGTQAEFYGGEDFAAAVSTKDAYVQEFLGNEKKLPGLLRALKLEQARVRLPGKQPTAMYLSLDGAEGLPGYFGLPAD